MQRIISVLVTGLCVLVPAAAAQAERPIASLEDVILLTQGSISDETILAFLDTREIAFELGAEEVLRLRQAGVSEKIIRYLLERTAALAESVPVDAGYAYRPTYYAYPPSYYATYYRGGTGYYYGPSILPYWWYDYHYLHHYGHYAGHLLGHHSIAGHGVRHLGHLAGGHLGHQGDLHPQAHRGGRHATTGHLGSGLHAVRPSLSHGTRSHNNRHDGSIGHSARRHRGLARRHGGHSRGHSGGHSRGHSSGHSRGHSGGHGGGHSGHGGGHGGYH